MKIGIVAGSFDPITLGHIWLIQQACHLMGKVYVVIGVNPAKSHWFSPEQRKAQIEASLKELLTPEELSKVRIHFLEKDLLINFAVAKKVHYIFRGIRTTDDFNYETQMQMVNRKICPQVETLFLVPPRDLTEVSSSTVKGLVGFTGWESAVEGYVSSSVLSDLRDRAAAKK